MVNYYVYAKDVLDSIDEVKHFHRNGLTTLESFKKEIEYIDAEVLAAGEPSTESKIVYLHWGNRCWEVDEEKTNTAYINMECEPLGTYPTTIMECLREEYDIHEKDKIKLLCIITDGLIERWGASEFFKGNQDMQYETVVFHAYNENQKFKNIAVVSSLFKSRCEVYRNNELYYRTDISKEFNYDKINIRNFKIEKNLLKYYIQLKVINKHKRDVVAFQEIHKLKKLKDRLFNELTMIKDSNAVSLETKDRNVFLRKFSPTDWYVNLTAAAQADKVDIENSISTLIYYIVRDGNFTRFMH